MVMHPEVDGGVALDGGGEAEELGHGDFIVTLDRVPGNSGPIASMPSLIACHGDVAETMECATWNDDWRDCGS